MLGAQPATQIRTTLCDQAQRQIGSEAVDLGQVGPEEVIEGLTDIKIKRVGLARALARLGKRRAG